MNVSTTDIGPERLPALPGRVAPGTDIPREPNGDTRSVIRLGLLVVLLGLGGFIGWAAFVPLDRAIAGSGALAVAQQRKTIQHASGGIVRTINVAEGSTVAAGQPLIEVDITQARSEREGVRMQRAIAWAAIERLRSHRAGAERLDFSPELRAYAEEPALAAALEVQRRLFDTRRRNFAAEGRQLSARIAQLETEVQGHRALGTRFEEQLRILGEQHRSLSDLARSGYYPKLNIMDRERELAEVRTDETRALADAARAERALVESRTALERRVFEQHRELETELVETQRQHAELQAREQRLRHTIEHSVVVAPVAGTVVGLSVHTLGGVVQAGEKLMDIVPSSDPFVVEARFPLAATERLATGQTAALHFATMEQARTPVAYGTVLTVSADRLEDQRSGVQYLLVRLGLPPDEVARLADEGIGMRAGLPVEVLVNVGQRTLLSYLLKPVQDRFAKALIE